jgi:hypothetical protein
VGAETAETTTEETARAVGTAGTKEEKDGIEPCPAPPSPGRATLHQFMYYCERVKDHRQRQAPMCRAFFKLEEAVARGGAVQDEPC